MAAMRNRPRANLYRDAWISELDAGRAGDRGPRGRAGCTAAVTTAA